MCKLGESVVCFLNGLLCLHIVFSVLVCPRRLNRNPEGFNMADFDWHFFFKHTCTSAREAFLYFHFCCHIYSRSLIESLFSKPYHITRFEPVREVMEDTLFSLYRGNNRHCRAFRLYRNTPGSTVREHWVCFF